MRVLVCGARDYNNRYRLEQLLDDLHAKYQFTLLIEGGAEVLTKWRMTGQ